MNRGRFGLPIPFGSRVITENLLANPGFETGDISGWSAVSGVDQGGAFALSDRGSDAAGLPRSGNFLWCPSASALSSLTQTIDVAAYGQAIDAGAVDAVAVGWFMSDDASIERCVLLLDALSESGTVLGGLFSPNIEPSPNHVWFPMTLRLALPPQTRRVRYTFRAIRLTGTNNNSNVDDCSLTLILH